MAAGLGFKDFTTGEVLTAADVDGYLMQGVWVFASATARDAAVTSPQEGNFAYLKDTNVTTYYTGSAWANLDTTGMTNPMTTTGDTIYSSSGSTPARLGIGTAGQVLTVNSGATAPEWKTPVGGGGKVAQVLQTIKTDTFTTSSNTFTDITGLSVSITPSSATSKIYVSFTVNGASDTDVSNSTGAIRLMRDSTAIAIGDAAGNRQRASGTNSTRLITGQSIQMNSVVNFLDSPATTSAVTYKMQALILGGAFYLNRSDDDSDDSTLSRTVSTITVMEILA
jgi:hypothetical protein